MGLIIPLHQSPYVITARRRIFTSRYLLSFKVPPPIPSSCAPPSLKCDIRVCPLSCFKINIYSQRLSVCEVSLQEFPVWGPEPLTRLNLPFQMKAALRETVLFGPSGRALPSDSRNVGCLERGSGSEERMPAMSMFVQGWLSIQLPVTCAQGQRV